MAHERGAYGLSASVVGAGPANDVHVRAVVVVLSIGFVGVIPSGRYTATGSPNKVIWTKPTQWQCSNSTNFVVLKALVTGSKRAAVAVCQKSELYNT